MKKILLSIAHVAVIGAGIAATVVFPGSIPIVVMGVGAVNGLLPSPWGGK